uniref:Uncharacterized protein n=1 Tax=Tanacetum cinerariifolium TaxID=118510 RepID=A0A6L2P727_TANCI|nr:hypothetical protein [Tanacetum cinerariifolium]
MLYHYKLGLSQVEARLVEFKNQENKFCKKIKGLEFNVECKNNRIERLTNELEELKKEKEGLDSKLSGFQSAAKDLDTLLQSQRSDKNKEGLRYSVVPPSCSSLLFSQERYDVDWGITITSSGNVLEHFIPNNPPLNLMLHLQSKVLYAVEGVITHFFIGLLRRNPSDESEEDKEEEVAKDKDTHASSHDGFAAALAVLITRASQSRQYGLTCYVRTLYEKSYGPFQQPKLDHSSCSFPVYLSSDCLWQILDLDFLHSIIQSRPNIIECIITKLVECINTHQSVLLVLILIYETSGIRLVIITTNSDPFQMFVIVPFDNLVVLQTSSRIYSSSTKLLHETFINSNVRPTLSSQTKFSLSGFGFYPRLLTPYISLRDKDMQKSKDPQVVVSVAKLPILNPNEFDLWKMRIEQVVNGVVQPIAPTTVEQRLAKKNELKARGTLLTTLPDKHQLKFNIYKDAKSLMETIKKRFGGNKETKKVQKTLLKQQYENFTGSSSKSLDQIHDRLQKLISQLEILAEFLSQEDINLNTNESVSAITSVSAASTKVLVYALPNVDNLNADDLEEIDLKWQMAMLTMRAKMFLQRTERNLGANGTTSTGFDMSKVKCYNCHRRVHFARECSYDWSFQADEEPTNYALMAFTSSSSSSSNNKVAPYSKACAKAYDTLQSHYDKLINDLRKSPFDVISYKTGLESFEARIVVYQQNEIVFEEDIKLLKLDVMLRNNALVDLRKKFEKAEQERDELKLKLENFQTSLKNLSQLLSSQITDKTGLGYNNQVFNSTVFDYDEVISSESEVSIPTSLVHDRYKSGEGYHDVPPPYIGTFMPYKPDLVFYDILTINETFPTVLHVEPSPTKPNMDLSQSNRPSAPIIKDWVSDLEDESEGEPMPTQKAPSFVQTFEHVKTPRPSVKTVEHPILAENLRKDIPKSKGHRHSWNRKACFVCKSLTHLIKDYDYYEKKMVQKPVRNHAMRGNHQYYARMTHPYPHRHVVPIAVLTRSRLVPLTAARHVTTVRTYLISLTLKKSMEDMLPLVEIQRWVPREKNMYNVDLKNIVPLGDLTCLFAKATLDESNLWHRRLGHINFKTMNKLVNESGPTWLFDIDTLTQSMNYQPVVVGNQPNSSAGIQEHFDAAKAGEGNSESEVHVSPNSSAKTKKHDDKTKREAKGKIHVELSTGVRNLSEEFEDFSFNSTNGVNAASTPVTAVESNSTNSTNTFSAAGPSNNVVSSNFKLGGKSSYVDPSQYLDDLDMPALEDITYSDDEEDVVAEADFSNLETNITVSPIPTTRVYKDHLVTQIIGDLSSAPQTRSMTRMDVKSDFLYETIEEEVYVCQPLGFKDPDYLDKVYKVVKALYGLHQAPRAWKFGLTDGKSACTPIDTEKPLLKDPDGDGKDVDVHTYRSMIGSLMYITSSRPDIMFAVCLCARFQVTLKASHLYAVKRIFSNEALAIPGQTATGHKTNDVVRLQALIDRRKVIITEDTVRKALRLDDADSIDCLPNEEIFVELARIGVGKGFSRVDTLLFDGMLAPQQVQDDIADVADAAEDEDAANEISAEPTPYSPTPTTTPPPQQEIIPSPSQVESTPPPSTHQSPIAQPSLPPPQQPPSYDAEISITLLNTLLETCTTLTKQAANLEQDKIAQAIKITKLKQRVKRLEKKKKLKASGLKREDASKQGEIAELDADEDVTLEEGTGMTYTDIRLIFEKHFNSIWAFLEKGEKDLEEEDGKRKSENLEQKAAKKQKIDEEVKELKTHLKLIPNDEDDVYTEATPLALKVPVINYQIHTEQKKPYYKIIRADKTHRLFLSFISLLRNFDREDLEMLWKIVQERFESSEPKNFSDDFLLNTFKTMFEKPNVEASI